jgi:hypothetical protein
MEVFDNIPPVHISHQLSQNSFTCILRWFVQARIQKISSLHVAVIFLESLHKVPPSSSLLFVYEKQRQLTCISSEVDCFFMPLLNLFFCSLYFL